MSHPRHPLVLTLLLLAIGMRTVFGAPCCLPMAEAAASHHEASAHQEHHAGHAEQPNAGNSHHGSHGEDPSANPCCSACGPTLPSEPNVLAKRMAVREVPQASAIRRLATRPPFPAYDATGPPLLI